MAFNLQNIEFKDDKSYLSNMYPCIINIDGHTYNSSENYYMSMKFVGVDISKVIQLRSCTPHEAKKSARKWEEDIRSDWNDIKLDVMRTAVLAKFTQNEDLYQKLLLTNDEYLEERNDWRDMFWGTYLGVGKNHLGIILMETRNLLRME